MNDTIIDDLEAHARKIEDAIWRRDRNVGDWISGTLELASELSQVRNKLTSNQAFGEWFDARFTSTGKTALSHQERAILIKWGKDIPRVRSILEKTNSRSIRQIDKAFEKSLLPKLPERNLQPRAEEARPFVRSYMERKNTPPPIEKVMENCGVSFGTSRIAIAYEQGRREGLEANEKMISVHVLIEEFVPLFERVKEQSKRHVGLISKGELLLIASEGQRLLDGWASDDPTVQRTRGHVVPFKPRPRKKG